MHGSNHVPLESAFGTKPIPSPRKSRRQGWGNRFGRDSQFLFFWRERQQNIPVHRIRVARVDVDHTVDDGGAGSVQRAAMAFYAVRSVKLLGGIEIPQNAAGVRVVCAEMSVERSDEDDSRNRRWRRHLRGTASELSQARGLFRRDMPDLLTSAEIEGEHSSANSRIIEIEIREREIGVAVVGRASPLDAAERAAVTDAALP